jgi:hypothetical protein
MSYNHLIWSIGAAWIVITIMLVVGVWALDRLLNTTKTDNMEARIAQLERLSGEPNFTIQGTSAADHSSMIRYLDHRLSAIECLMR